MPWVATFYPPASVAEYVFPTEGTDCSESIKHRPTPPPTRKMASARFAWAQTCRILSV